MPDTDEYFVENLKRSQEVTEKVRAHFAGRGHNIRIVPAQLRPRREEAMEYSDDGDLELTHRIEVKYRPNFEFHSVEEFLHPTIMLDRSYRLELKHTSRLLGYVVVNRDCTGFLWVGVKTRPNWVVEKKYEKKCEREIECYFCPRELAEYHELT